MSTRRSKVAPFIDEDRERLIHKTQNSLASYVVMAIGWTLLTIALISGAYYIYSYLAVGIEFRLAQLIVLALIYLAGWVVSLISIRALHNLIMPVVIKVYSFGVLAAVLLVYGRGIYKIFNYYEGQSESALPGNIYLFMLLAGYILLISLYLLVSNFNLAPHAIILVMAVFVHLVIMVYNYVFDDPGPAGLVSYDIYLLVAILLIALLLPQKWIYRPIKGTLASRFREKNNISQ